MKKILNFALIMSAFIFLTTIVASADEITDKKIDYMPSDEEIMETIKSYHFDSKKEEAVFKETKKRLQQMYDENNKSEEEKALEVNN